MNNLSIEDAEASRASYDEGQRNLALDDFSDAMQQRSIPQWLQNLSLAIFAVLDSKEAQDFKTSLIALTITRLPPHGINRVRREFLLWLLTDAAWGVKQFVKNSSLVLASVQCVASFQEALRNDEPCAEDSYDSLHTIVWSAIDNSENSVTWAAARTAEGAVEEEGTEGPARASYAHGRAVGFANGPHTSPAFQQARIAAVRAQRNQVLTLLRQHCVTLPTDDSQLLY